MRLKPFLSRALFVVLFVIGLAIASGVHIQAQAPFLMFGSNSGVAQPINATNNAIWVSAQGGNALPTGVAIGQVLVSNGVGAAPVYSASPTLTSVSVGNGNSATAGFNFSAEPGLGISRISAGLLTIQNDGVYGMAQNTNYVVWGSGYTIGLASTVNPTVGGPGDGALSRLGPASWAFGNGTPGDFTGTLKLATVNATTALQLNGVDIVSAQTCSNTAASTDVTGTASKTYFSLNCKVPANALAAGDTIQFKVRGLYSGNVTDTMTMTVEACQVSGCASGTKVTLATTGALTLTAVSNQAFLIDEDLVTFTTGTSGTIDTQGYAQYETASTTAIIDSTPNTTTATVATNVDEYLSVSVTFSSSSGSNHASIRNLIGVIQ